MYIISVQPPPRTPYAGWSPCIDWCKKNCLGKWQYDTEGVFIFHNDKDATAFTLVWG